MSWHAVDGRGLDLGTGRPPAPPGRPSPAAALAAAPVPAWPVSVVGPGGQEVGVAAALGPGGPRVAGLAAALAGATRPDAGLDVEGRARSTPAGTVDLPVAVVPGPEAAAAAGHVDPVWLAAVEEARRRARLAVSAAGRGSELDAALNLVMLLAAARLRPGGEGGGEGAGGDGRDIARLASGGELWILGGAVASALAGALPDPFGPWADLVAHGFWPVGPSAGRLVVGARPPAPTPAPAAPAPTAGAAGWGR